MLELRLGLQIALAEAGSHALADSHSPAFKFKLKRGKVRLGGARLSGHCVGSVLAQPEVVAGGQRAARYLASRVLRVSSGLKVTVRCAQWHWHCSLWHSAACCVGPGPKATGKLAVVMIGGRAAGSG